MPEMISFLCSKCSKEIETEAEYAGATSNCPFCDEPVVVPFVGLLPGKAISAYELKKRLGMGGMGEVWLAYHAALDRDIALKILSPTLTKDANFVDRFLKEARMAAKIEHPNVIAAYDAGFDQGVYFLATSFADGHDVDSVLDKEKRISEERALEITKAIAIALKDVWNKHKMIHRDIKPANIMLTSEGTVKLMDMGLAKCFDEAMSMTMTGVVMGTPHYISPEQAKGEKEVDYHSDIYSLGASLYHMIAGRVPFNAETAMGILSLHITEPLEDPAKIIPGISPQCAALIQIMMEKDPKNRQICWEEVIDDIERVQAGQYPGKLKRKNKKKLPILPIVAIVLAVLTCLVGVLKAFQYFKRQRQAAQKEQVAQPNRVNPVTNEKKNKSEKVDIPAKIERVHPKSSSKSSSTPKVDEERNKVIKMLEKIVQHTGYSLSELKQSKSKFEEFRNKEYSPTEARQLMRDFRVVHEAMPDAKDQLTMQEIEIIKALGNALRRSAKERLENRPFRDMRNRDDQSRPFQKRPRPNRNN